MFNLFSILILERLQGRKLPVILSERSGTSEKTWRTRLKEGWTPRPEELSNFRERTATHFAEQMKTKGEWSAEEVKAIISRNPSWKAGIGLPTADLIYWYSPGYGADYAESIAVAGQFDLYCHALFDANKAGDRDGARQVLLDALDWLIGFCPEDTERADGEELRQRLIWAGTLESLMEEAHLLGEQLLFHVLSCWDAEFCSRYFNGKVEAYPLFELVMPRLSPTIAVEEDTNRFLRAGQPPRRGVFERSIARFLDFVAVLIHWHKYREPPDKVPSVRDMAAWFNQDERRIVSWRDETTHLTVSQLFEIWKTATGPDKKGNYPSIPTPMFLAAHLFSPLLVCEGGKPKHWVICFDGYELWWQRNRDRLMAKGLEFGSIPWPKCLTDQPAGNRSPESWRSSQSSGRSSQPLDSQ